MAAHELSEPNGPAHESIRPGEKKKRHVRIDSTGGSLSPRGWATLIGIVLSTVIAGGGYSGFRLVTADVVDEAIEAKAAIVELVDNRRHGRINDRLAKHDDAIEGFTATIGKVAKSQHREEASQEAHRLTAGIRDRIRREREYERLRSENVDRLEAGDPPCYNLACTN